MKQKRCERNECQQIGDHRMGGHRMGIILQTEASNVRTEDESPRLRRHVHSEQKDVLIGSPSIKLEKLL